MPYLLQGDGLAARLAGRGNADGLPEFLVRRSKDQERDEAWEAACQMPSVGPLRMEGVLHGGDRLMLNRSTPITALRGMAELRVSSPHLISPGSSRVVGRSTPPQQTSAHAPPVIPEPDPVNAVDAAVKRSAVEAVATSSVLHELMEELSPMPTAPAET